MQVSAPGEVVPYVDRHPVTVPRRTAACTEHQLLNPQMTSRAEESSADASRLGDDDLLQEAVRPLDDSVSTASAAVDATNTRLITVDLTHTGDRQAGAVSDPAHAYVDYLNSKPSTSAWTGSFWTPEHSEPTKR